MMGNRSRAAAQSTIVVPEGVTFSPYLPARMDLLERSIQSQGSMSSSASGRSGARPARAAGELREQVLI